jgi:hypothetical protein
MGELAVKRNNGGSHLNGQLFDVTPELISLVRERAPGWAEQPDKQIAKTIVNSVPIFDLARPTSKGATSRAIFHTPGGQKLTVPVLICEGDKFPQLFLGDERKIKQV